MSKFTKGKWESRKPSFIYAPEGYHISQDKPVKGVAIAHMCLLDSINGSNPEEEMNANARLIAAAPEMYRLLLEIAKDGCNADFMKWARFAAVRLLARIDGEQEAGNDTRNEG